MKNVRHLLAAALLAGAPLACGSESTAPFPGSATFVVQVGEERFAIRVTDQATYEQLHARRLSGKEGVILGRIAAGHGGFNQPWSWHLIPESIVVADVAIELCDGRPSYVEADLDYWMNTVKNYCPWGAKVMMAKG